MYDGPSEAAAPIIAEEGEDVEITQVISAYPALTSDAVSWMLHLPNGDKTIHPEEEYENGQAFT